MNKFFDIFQNDDDWDIKECAAPDGVCVAQFSKKLVAEIRDLLSGDTLSWSDYYQMWRQFECENLLFHGKHAHVIHFLAGLRYYGVRCNSYSSDIKSWKEAFYKFMLLERMSIHKSKYEPDASTIIKVEAISVLRELGYEIPLIDGAFAPTMSDDKKFAAEMRQYFSLLGNAIIPMLLKLIDKRFDKNLSRYDFYPEPVMIGKPTVLLPMGYLLNFGLAFFDRRPLLQGKRWDKIWNQALNLAKRYFVVYELQTFEKMEVMLKSCLESLDEIRNLILYQQHIAIDQMPLYQALDIIKGMMINVQGRSDLDVIVSILEFFLLMAPDSRGCRTLKEDVVKSLAQQFPIEMIECALEDMAIDIGDVNKSYSEPLDVSKRNFYKKPLVRNGEEYILLNPYFCAKSFYLVWLSRINDDNLVGDLFEDYVSALLKLHHVAYYKSEKYKIYKSDVSNLNIQAQGGECDFIVATDDTICFIELKKKEITGEAMSGNDLKVLDDLARSTLAAWNQGFLHEYLLRKKGRIEFESGNVLELKGRLVEKIHLSLFDRYALHDQVLLTRLVDAVSNLNFSCKQDPVGLDEFIKKQNRFIALKNSSEIASAYKERSLKHTFRSFSTPQLLTMLSNVNSTEEFVDCINMTKGATTSCRDWYKEYALFSLVKRD